MFYVQVGVYRHVFHTLDGDVEVESTKLDANTVWREYCEKNNLVVEETPESDCFTTDKTEVVKFEL